MLVSRATKQAGALSATLKQMGCEVIEIPFIEIRKPSSFVLRATCFADIREHSTGVPR